MPLAVVLVSGGMDSLVAAAIAAESFELAFMHCNYGQRTEAKELDCFNSIADHYGVTQRLVVDALHIGRMGGSSLTDRAMQVEKADLTRNEIPSTYVPFRNAQMLSFAAGWAETIRAERIVIGAVEEDSSGYPDCRRAFFEAFNETICLGTRPETRILIETPVISMRKAEIVRTGLRLGAPFGLSWSCYTESRLACGKCDSCALRLRAFQEAGAGDPIPYAI